MSNFAAWWTFCMNPNRDGQANDGTTDGAGVTRWGWTYPTWCDAMRYVGQGDKANLTTFTAMTKEGAGTLAQAFIWDKNGGRQLAAGPDVCFIDWLWNSGRGGVEEIQQRLGFTGSDIDGVVGPMTLGRIAAMGPAAFVENCYMWRVSFLNDLGYQHRFPGLYTRTADCRALARTLL